MGWQLRFRIEQSKWKLQPPNDADPARAGSARVCPTEAKAAQEQAQKKLDETSAAFEEIEAAEQTAKEKLEFFESAYGA